MNSNANIEVRVNSEIEAAAARAQDLKANLSLLLILPIGLLAYLSFNASSHTTGPKELIPTLTVSEVSHWIGVNETIFADRETDARTRAAHSIELEALRDRLVAIGKNDAAADIAPGLAAIDELLGSSNDAVTIQVAALTTPEAPRELTLAERVEDIDHRTAQLEWIVDHPGTSFDEKSRTKKPVRELIDEVKTNYAVARAEGDVESKESLANLRNRLGNLLSRSTTLASLH